MLCPNCKNEKWNDEACPHCGLDHPAALLSQADHYHRDGLNLQAARTYDDYLRLNPDSWDVLRKRAIAWYGETVSTKNKSLFDKADQALVQTLDQDWDWEQGHQFRVNLYYAFGRLEEMTREYSKTLAEVPGRAIMAAKVLKVIQLTEKFVEANADEEKSEPGFWPNPLWVFLVAVTPIWVWFLVKTIFPAFWRLHPSDSYPSLWLIVCLCVGATLLFFIVRYFRGNIRKGSARKAVKKPDLNFPEL